MFLKEFEIRWNDLDANRHLANITYLSYASETRMAYLNHIGLTHKDLHKKAIGPIVFNEQLFYFKELFSHTPKPQRQQMYFLQQKSDPQE